MRINDTIYFSPNLKLNELDLSNQAQILASFPERIESYYLKPVENLVQQKMAFAAGAIEFLLIDAFSRYSSQTDEVGKRIKKWCIDYLGLDKNVAKEFYEYFRCGILHESYVKQFGQFSFDVAFKKPVQEMQGYIVVNPEKLLIVLRQYLVDFVARVGNDTELYQIFLERLTSDFKNEIELAR